MKHTLRILCITITTLLLLLGASGCSLLADGIYTMPETEVSLSDVQMTVPYGYIQDSTQSSATTLVYETGFYAKYIILTKTVTVADGEEDAVLDRYAASILEGGSSQRTTFLEQPAVRSTFTSQDGKTAEEMLFIYKGYCYAISMRGGTEQEFQDLLSTVVLIHKTTQM